MAATISSRRPKLSLQISAQPSPSFQPIQHKPKPVLSVPISAVKNSRSFYSDLSDSEEDAKFWSGEDISSATSSSEDEDNMMSYHSKPSNGNTVVLPSPSCTSPFLPPASGMRFPTPSQRPGMTKLRLMTALPQASSIASPTVGSNPRHKLSLTIPPPLPRRLGVLPSPISPITAPQAPLRKSCLSSSLKPRKSVAFSSSPDVVIATSKYTLANSDLLEYLSSEECSEEELADHWGMTPEEGRMLGMPRGSMDRRERKWIGLINAFNRNKKSEENDEE